MKTVKLIESRKTIHFLTATLVVVMMFASCEQNEPVEIDENFDTTENTEVRFTGSIVEQALLDNAGTRMSGTTWEAGDAIGIFMMSFDEYLRYSIIENKHYTTDGSGNFYPVQGNELYYPVDGSFVYFYAYYPYNEDIDETMLVDVKIGTEQTAENQPNFDFLFANFDVGYNKTSESVALKFYHKLSKIVMNIVQPSSLSPNNTGITDDDLQDMEVTIIGMYTEVDFHLNEGVSSKLREKNNITPRTIQDGLQYDAIVVPTSYNDDNRIKINFTLKSTGETFTWTMPNTDFLCGNQYTYDISITRSGVFVKSEISDWNEIVNHETFIAN